MLATKVNVSLRGAGCRVSYLFRWNFCYLHCLFFDVLLFEHIKPALSWIYFSFWTFAFFWKFAGRNRASGFDPKQNDCEPKCQPFTLLVVLATPSTLALYWFHSSMGYCAVLFGMELSMLNFLKYIVSSSSFLTTEVIKAFASNNISDIFINSKLSLGVGANPLRATWIVYHW